MHINMKTTYITLFMHEILPPPVFVTSLQAPLQKWGGETVMQFVLPV